MAERPLRSGFESKREQREELRLFKGSILLGVQLLLLFISSVVITLAAIPLIRKLATTRGWLDHPDSIGSESLKGEHPRRIHKTPIPRLGGLGFFLGFMISAMLWADIKPVVLIYLMSAFMFLTGFIDDFYPLSAKLRFLVQVSLAVLTVWLGDLSLPAIVLTTQNIVMIPHWLGFGLSVFVIVGAVNAINLIDGLDGLAGGICLIALSLMSIVYFSVTQDYSILALFSIPMIGGILGFLKYNTHPANIFMGDGGSNWLGFMVGVFFIVVTGGFDIAGDGQSLVSNLSSSKGQFQVIPLISTVMCLAVPIFDTLSVIFLRLKSGLHPMSPDKRHFHHTLMKLGLSHPQCVTSIYFITIVFGVLGTLPVVYPQYQFWWAPYLGAIVLLVGFPLLTKFRDGVIRFDASRYNLTRSKVARRGYRLTIRAWGFINRYLVYAIIIGVSLLAPPVSVAMGYAAGLMAAVLFLTGIFQRKVDFHGPLLLTVALTILLIANNQGQIAVMLLGQKYQVQHLYNSLFVVLLFSSFFYIVFTFQKHDFVATPSDFLSISLPLLLLIIPDPYRREYMLIPICLRSLVMFVAFRSFSKRSKQILRRFRLSILAGLALIFVKSVLALKVVY